MGDDPPMLMPGDYGRMTIEGIRLPHHVCSWRGFKRFLDGTHTHTTQEG